jgi:hypothetical protein
VDLSNFLNPAASVEDMKDGEASELLTLAQDPAVIAATKKSWENIGGVETPWAPEGTEDPIKYAWEWGWSYHVARERNVDMVPVNFGKQGKSDPESGLFDEAGTKAATQFGEHAESAEEIWDQFREKFQSEDVVLRIFTETYPQYTFDLGQDVPGGITDLLKDINERGGAGGSGRQLQVSDVDTLAEVEALWTAQKALTEAGHGMDTEGMFRLTRLTQIREVLKKHPEIEQQARMLASQKTKAGRDVFDEVMREFKKFMWRNPYHRGWLVRTVDAQFNFVSGVASNALSLMGAAGGAFVFGPVGAAIGLGIGSALESIDVVKGALTAVGHFFGGDDQKDWNFHNAHQVWKIFISDGPHAASTWMREHRDLGKDNRGILGRLGEEFYTGIVDPIKDMAGQVATVIGGVASGLSAFIRLSLLQMNHGVGMKNNMQRRVNMLNRLYNDSIYFDAGEVTADGPNLHRMIDNPFTREYGEPVIEIREPFQRIHHLSSFQHIIHNGIIESMDEVATVVTAVSNGSHPVTVHFDKGANAEFQREKVVDTGLLWDNIEGLPFLKNLPLIGTLTKPISAIFHPVKTIRGGIKSSSGVSDEISSKRVALWHLRESLKDIYQGEILIIGDSGIRPHDIVYLSDVYERMYGFFEVEAVTHHFTPETGFITSIVPNALVSVNDPARWSIMSYLRHSNDKKHLRDYLRASMRVRMDNQGNVAGAGETYNMNDLVQMSSNVYEDMTQYTGGIAAVVKDIAGLSATGGLIASAGGASTMGIAHAALPALAGTPLAAIGGLGMYAFGTLVWGAWKWVRDNLLDQHGCYIQYLTKQGQPMDANLGPNSSVAVGRQHGTTFTIAGMKLGTIGTRGDKPGADGELPVSITSSELFTAFGSPPRNVDGIHKFASKAMEDSYKRLGRMMARGEMLPGQYDVFWVKVMKVKDGDTIYVKVLDDGKLPGEIEGGLYQIRFLVAGAPEDHFSDKDHAFTGGDKDPQYVLEAAGRSPGVESTLWMRRRLLDKGESSISMALKAQMDRDGTSLGPYDYEVALRVMKDKLVNKDKFGRTLAFIFHQGLRGQSKADRKKYILEMAKSDTDWQNYTSQGMPLTINQEVIAAGKASVEIDHLKRSMPGYGIELAGQ